MQLQNIRKYVPNDNKQAKHLTHKQMVLSRNL